MSRPPSQPAATWGSLVLVTLLIQVVAQLLVPAAPATGTNPGQVPGALGPATEWRWPLADSPQVSRGFDPPAQPWLPGHRGVDLIGEPGAVVHAAGAGSVHFAGEVAGVAVISITHGGQVRTTYQPVTPLVATGAAVQAGDPIGLLAPGHAGCPSLACLHWGLRQGDSYLDPLSLLGFGRFRLLPRSPR